MTIMTIGDAIGVLRKLILSKVSLIEQRRVSSRADGAQSTCFIDEQTEVMQMIVIGMAKVAHMLMAGTSRFGAFIYVEGDITNFRSNYILATLLQKFIEGAASTQQCS